MVKSVYVPEAGGIIDFADDVTPTQISGYINAKYPRAASAPAAQESDNSSITDRMAYGFGTMFTEIPGGVASLMYPASREEETWGGRLSKSARELGQRNLNIDPTKTPTTTQQFAQGIGSLLGFAIPGALVAKGVSAAGAGVAFARAAGVGAVSAQGAAVGAEQRSEQIRNQLASGMQISEEQQLSAQRGSALIGTLEGLPMGKFFEPIGILLSKVPASKAGIVEKILENRLSKVIGAGTGEGLQEASSGVANDLMEYGVYNPNVEIGQDLLSNAAGGAFAGSLLEGVIQLAAGRKVRGARQLQADLQTEAQKNSEDLRKISIAESANGLAQSGVEGNVTIEPNETPEGFTVYTLLGADNKPITEFQTEEDAIQAVDLYKKTTGASVNIDVSAPPKLSAIRIGNKKFPTLEAAADQHRKIKARVNDLVKFGDNFELVSKMAAEKGFTPQVFAKQISDEIAAAKRTLSMFDRYFSPEAPAAKTKEEVKQGPKVSGAPVNSQAMPVEEPAQKTTGPSINAGKVAIDNVDAVDIDYETLTYDEVQKKAIPSSGRSKIIDYGGRKIVIVNVNGKNVPYYLSTGLAGKTKVPAGKWYPFFGIGADGWINKSSQEEMANYYGSEELANMAKTLDSTIGDIRNDTSIPKVKSTGAHIDAINAGLNPSENDTPETGDRVRKNIDDVVSSVRSNEPIASEEEIPDMPIGAVEMPVEESRILPDSIVEEDAAIAAAAEPAPEAPVATVKRPSATDEDLTNLQTEMFGKPIGLRNMTPEQKFAYDAERDRRFPPEDVDVYQSAGRLRDPAPRNLREAHISGPTVKDYTPETKAWLKNVYTQLQNRLEAIVPNQAKLELKTLVGASPDYLIRGQASTIETPYGIKSIVDLATGTLRPGMTVEKAVKELVGTLNHEMIHVLRDKGVIRPEEWRILSRAVAKTNVPGKQYTYLDKAEAVYTPNGMPMNPTYSNPDSVVEEAVAEMYREWVLNGLKPPQQAVGLFNRITEFLRRIFQVLRNARHDEIFKQIESGEVGRREGTARVSPAKASAGPVVRAPGTPMSPDLNDRNQTAFGLYPYLRTVSPKYYTHKRMILGATNPGNAAEQIANLDILLARHPNTLASDQAFADYLADAAGKLATEQTGVPIVPYAAVKFANDPSAIAQQLARMTPGQLQMAEGGLSAAKDFEAAYKSGTATPTQTAKLILWGILSRGVSPFVQESMFLDVVKPTGISNRTGMAQGGIDQFINDAVSGEFDLGAYNDYIKTLKLDGLPGAGTTHNLGAFGRTTLVKLQQRIPDGRTILQYLHDLISDYSLSGKEIRRRFHEVNPGIGINNKVLSFMMLVSGRDDVLVLDRVQMRNQFNNGLFDDYNMYDGEKIEKEVTKRDGSKKLENVTDTGTGIAPIGDGVFGLMYYEALERDLTKSIRQAYNLLGRGNQFSMGRYHWESWVATSSQEVDHGSVTGLIKEATGEADPYGGIYTGEGKYDTFNSGIRYGYTKEGEAYVALPDGMGKYYFFTPEFAKKVIKGYSRASTRIISGANFKVSESTEGPWYDRPEVNKERLRQYLRAQTEIFRAERGNAFSKRVSEIGETDTNGSGPGPVHANRRRIGGVRQPFVTYPKLGTRFSAAPVNPQEFQRWFRNSKAVNPDGTPQRWLHGTPVSFKQFGKGRSGSVQGEDGPFFFSQNPEFVEDYSLRRNYAGGDRGGVVEGGQTIPVYLSVQNPFDYNSPKDVAAVVAKLREMHNQGRYPIIDKTDRASPEALENRFETIGYDLEDGDWPTIEKENVQRAIRELGYDGFFIKENKQRNLAVYKPEQVKSIFNRFEEGAATDARFSAAPVLNSPEFKAWFGGSKVRNPDGSPKIVYHGTSKTGKTARMFSDNPLIAEDYARFPNVNGGMGPSVVKAYLVIKNPVPDTEMRGFDPESVLYDNEWIDYQKSKGFDGYVFKDLGSTSGNLGGLNYVVFDSNQAKVIDVKRLDQLVGSTSVKDSRFSAAPLPPYIQQQNSGLFAPAVNVSTKDKIFNHFSGRRWGGKTLSTMHGQIEISGSTMAGIAGKEAVADKNAYITELEKLLNQKLYGNYQRMEANYSATAALAWRRRSSHIFASMLLRGNVEINFDRPGDIQSATIKVVDDTDSLKEIFNVITAKGPTDANGVQTDKSDIFRSYAVARRGEWLRASGQSVPAQLTPQYVREVTDFTVREYPEVVEAYNKYQRFNKKLLTTAKDAGIISQVELGRLTNQMNYYGFIYEAYGEPLGPTSSQKTASKFKLRPYTGTQVGGLTSDPMFVMMQNAQFWVDSIAKNIAATKAFELTRVMNESRLLGTDEAPDELAGEAPDVMFFSQNGVVKRFAVKDPSLVVALGSDDRLNVGKFWDMIGLPTHILRESVTRDPGFMARNLLRDTVSAWVTSGADFMPVIDTIKGGVTALKNGASYKALGSYGVVGSYDLAMLGPAELAAVLRRNSMPLNVHSVTTKEGAVAALGSLWNRLGHISEASDAATRIAVYDAVKKQGLSDAEAAMQAIELLDFTRRGSSQALGILTKLIPFLNARIQGMDVLYQAGRSGIRYAMGKSLGERDANVGKKFLLRGGMLAVIATALEALNQGDDDYEQLDDYIKTGNLIVPLKMFGLEGQFLAIPKAFEVGLLFNTIPQQIYKTTTGEASTRENAELFWGQIQSTFGVNPIPQALLPAFEIITNHNFYTGLPLISEGKLRLDPSLQYNTSTSQIAMMLGGLPIFYDMTTGKFGGISPIVVDKLISGYGGPLGTYLVQANSFAMEGASVGPDRMPTEISSLPVIRSFFIDAKSKNPKVVTQAYELFRIADEANRTMSRLRQMGDAEALANYVDQNRDILSRKKYIFTLADRLNKLSAQERSIERDTTMSRDEKLAAQQKLREIRIRLSSQVDQINKTLGR